MAHVVGGNGIIQCQNGGQFNGEICVCPPDFYGQYCEVPVDAGTGPTLTITVVTTVTLIITDASCRVDCE